MWNRDDSRIGELTPADIIERSQWDFFWVPEDAVVTDRPELLFVRCPRESPLLNCVTRTRADGARLPALVAEVMRAHEGFTSRWLVRDGWWRSDLESALRSASYEPHYEHGAYALVVGTAPSTQTHERVLHVRDMKGMRDWYRVDNEVFGVRDGQPEHELETYLEECTRPGARVHRFVAYEQEEPVSCGGMTAFTALRFGYLWAGATRKQFRGRGCYRSLLHARVARARDLGLTSVGVYARLDSSAPIVERVGFSRHGSMTYWDKLYDVRPKEREDTT